MSQQEDGVGTADFVNEICKRLELKQIKVDITGKIKYWFAFIKACRSYIDYKKTLEVSLGRMAGGDLAFTFPTTAR
jgi:hypothetical protein